jgi:superfamily I DNA/RNA helicase
MSEFENELTGSRNWLDSDNATTLFEVGQELAELVEFAVAKSKQEMKRQMVTRDEVYHKLLSLPSNPPPQGIFRDWVDFINGLPRTIAGLISSRRVSLRPLLAYIGARTNEAIDFRRYEHVILDEAQDIYPIQWETLGRLGNPGGWTIFGDLNQRRTDHTYGAWEPISDLLGFGGDGIGHPINVLDIGYRSTSQIMKFADQLLPRSERKIFSIQQDGERPKVVRVTKKDEIQQVVLREVSELIERVESGTVAIIATTLDPISKQLTKNGWRKNAVGNSWRKDEKAIQLFLPDRARGLEFDGVVVLEPANFPENLGRSGVLYTALTRANKFLTIVHSRALPRGMKREV